MKKVILFAAALLVCGAMSAQQKGDMSVSGTIGVSGGSSRTSIKVNTTTNKGDRVPNDAQFNFGAEFGYFLFDNFKLSIGMGYGLTSTPTVQDKDDKWLKDHQNVFTIGPSVAYYVKIVDGLYYTPEVGFYGAFGNYKEKTTDATVKTKFSGFALGINFAAVEFRPLDHFGFAASLFSLQYANLKHTDEDKALDIKTTTRVSNVGVNFILNPTVCVRYYF